METTTTTQRIIFLEESLASARIRLGIAERRRPSDTAGPHGKDTSTLISRRRATVERLERLLEEAKRGDE